MRLTRRGRLVVLTLVLLALTAGALSLGRPSETTSPAQAGQVVRYVTIREGQTLWDVAREVSPGDDPRELVRRIAEINGLSSSALMAGQRLALPAGG